MSPKDAEQLLAQEHGIKANWFWKYRHLSVPNFKGMSRDQQNLVNGIEEKVKKYMTKYPSSFP